MKIERADGLAWRRVERETFVVDLHRKWMYGLNETGGMVWHAIVAGDEVESMIRRLCLASGASLCEAEAGRVLGRFLCELADLGLVSLADLDPRLAGDEVPDGVADGTVPAVTWQEELRAFAFSCSDNAINCQDVQPTT